MAHTILLLPLRFRRSESNTGSAGNPFCWSLAPGSAPSCSNAWTQPCMFDSLELFSRVEQMFQLKAAEGCPWTSDSPGNPIPLSPKSTAAFLQHNAELAASPPSGTHPAPAQKPGWVPQGEGGPIPTLREDTNTQKALWRGHCCHPHISYSAEPFWDSRGSGRSQPNSLGIINGAELGIAAKGRRKRFSKEYRKFYCGQSY